MDSGEFGNRWGALVDNASCTCSTKKGEIKTPEDEGPNSSVAQWKRRLDSSLQLFRNINQTNLETYI